MTRIHSLCLAVVALGGLGLFAQACSSENGVPQLPTDDAATDAEPAPVPDAEPAPEPDAAPDAAPDADSGPGELGPLQPGEFELSADSCGEAPSCGGAVAGTDFAYTGGCFDEQKLAQTLAGQINCSGLTVSGSQGYAKGSLEFGSAGEYKRTLSLRFRTELVVPGSCLQGLPIGCSGVATLAQQYGIPGLRCVNRSPDGCDCTMTGERALDSRGSFVVGTTSPLQVTSDNIAQRLPYCVDGVALSHSEDISPAAGGQVNIESYVRWQAEAQP